MTLRALHVLVTGTLLGGHVLTIDSPGVR